MPAVGQDAVGGIAVDGGSIAFEVLEEGIGHADRHTSGGEGTSTHPTADEGIGSGERAHTTHPPVVVGGRSETINGSVKTGHQQVAVGAGRSTDNSLECGLEGYTGPGAEALFLVLAVSAHQDGVVGLGSEAGEAVGGGVCQVSSTLYNAAIRAELEVVERSPHSMIVTYVQPSMDAAIAGDYKDFKFRNNTDAPIDIQGYTKNRKCYFVIYGEETRDPNRKVTFVFLCTTTANNISLFTVFA